jgi:hypothetical protein
MVKKNINPVIDNFTDFVKYLEVKKKELAKLSKYNFPLFRGHANGSWPLTPTLLRSNKLNTPQKIFEQESAFFHDFITQAGHRISSKNSWHTLFSMRHHGVPTRLMDWTENLFVALYFALMDSPSQVENPCIWIIDPYLLNRRTKKITGGYIINPEFEMREYFDLFCKECKTPKKPSGDIPDFPIALYPFRHHDRLISQSGLFTMHGINVKPLDELAPDCLIKVPIPDTLRNDIVLLLEVAGFNQFTIYQDFDSLAKYLKQLYEFK